MPWLGTGGVLLHEPRDLAVTRAQGSLLLRPTRLGVLEHRGRWRRRSWPPHAPRRHPAWWGWVRGRRMATSGGAESDPVAVMRERGGGSEAPPRPPSRRSRGPRTLPPSLARSPAPCVCRARPAAAPAQAARAGRRSRRVLPPPARIRRVWAGCGGGGWQRVAEQSQIRSPPS